MTPVPFEKLSEERKGEGSVEIRKRVTAARELQTERFKDLENLPAGRQGVHYNAQMTTKHILPQCSK